MSNFHLIQELSLTTKALVVVNEFTTRRMEPSQLAELLQMMVRSAEEYHSVVELVQNELRAANYAPTTISGLTDTLVSVVPAAPDPSAMKESTQELRSPFQAPFEADATQKMSMQTGIPNIPEGTVMQPDEDSVPAARKMPRVQPPAKKQAASPFGALPPLTTEKAGTPPSAKSRRPISMPPGASPASSPKGKKTSMPKVTQRTARTRSDMPGAAGETQVFFGATGQQMSGVAKQVNDDRITVLVADDDKRIRMIYRIKLEEAGYHVLEEADGLSAWNTINERRPALVVLDMKMPGCHGLEVMKRMVDAGITLPVVICSAYDQLGDEFIVATYPQYRYLTKPVGPEKILAAVQELLQAAS